jgi:hypothetical protein
MAIQDDSEQQVLATFSTKRGWQLSAQPADTGGIRRREFKHPRFGLIPVRIHPDGDVEIITDGKKPRPSG